MSDLCRGQEMATSFVHRASPCPCEGLYLKHTRALRCPEDSRQVGGVCSNNDDDKHCVTSAHPVRGTGHAGSMLRGIECRQALERAASESLRTTS